MAQFIRSAVTLVIGFVAFFWIAAHPGRPRYGADAPPAVTDGQKVVLSRSADGHFYTDAQVNGHTIEFMVDTGATVVALSKEDAEAVGISTEGGMKDTAYAASGSIPVTHVMIDTLGIGSVEETGVDAEVMEGDVHVSLLGQSWLRRLGSVTITGDKMTLE